MWVPLNFRERSHWLWSSTKCSRWPTERAWFSCKIEKTPLWFWPRGWHAPPALWPEGSQHQQVSRWHKASHLTLKTEVPERQKGGRAFPEPSASPLAVKGGEGQAWSLQTFQWGLRREDLPDDGPSCHHPPLWAASHGV